MLKLLSKFTLFLIILITGFSFLFINYSKAVGTLEEAFGNKLNETATGAGYPSGQGEATLNDSIVKIINTALSFLGIIFLILIIYAGFTWMTAGGDSAAVGKAQKMIIAATVGLIIVISAYAISKFILEKLWGSSSTTSTTPAPTK